MTLRIKILLALIVVFSLYVAADSAIQQYVVFPRFLSLEQQEAKRNLNRCHQAIARDIEHLDMFAHDWSAWDDLHRYAIDRNTEFEEENFVDSLFTDSKLNLTSVIDINGDVVYHRACGSGFENSIDIEQFPGDQWPETHPLLDHESSDKPLAERFIGGLMMTEHGPLVVVSRPILQSDNGGPNNGTLVMGRFLDEEAVRAISQQTSVAFSIASTAELSATQRSGLPSSLSKFLDSSSGEIPVAVSEFDESHLVVRSAILDLVGKPILITRADIGRDISKEGRAAMQHAIVSLVVAALVVLAILLLLLQKIVISPLIRLSVHASKIGETGDLTSRASMSRSDELGNLAQQFDAMVEKLADTQSRLIEISREAGMSDVATGVLHNVGNVMTNVNVLNASMASELENSKLSALKRSADMLRAHEADLGQFLATDPRGQQLPKFICQVTDKLEQEHLDILEQIRSMTTNLEHVNQILATQQKLAKGTSVLEAVRLERLVADAIGMLRASLDRHKVSVRLDLADLPSVRLDRGKLIQILVNLLANAKDAVKCLDPADREITISATAPDETHILIEVADRGCGIATDDLDKIFASGYTTKPEGNGQGLHFCALAAKEIESSLSARSDGPGQGAVFALSLPTAPVLEPVS